MLDAKIKKQWVRALRSGKYRQAYGALVKEPGAYCCLGVLCKVQNAPDSALPFLGAPPLRWRAGMGIEDQDVLIEMNDTARWSFDMIADYIEVML